MEIFPTIPPAGLSITFMKKLSFVTQSLVSTILIGGYSPSLATSQNEQSVRNLKQLSLEELLDVEVVSIATGTEQTTITAPAVTSVVTARDIEMTAATDIDEVLETLPGLHVARNPSSYYNPIYTLGGIYSIYNPETLVLINGVSTNTLYTGGRILLGYGKMPVTAISRIEVIRGPGSALYGADALAGVINIITKTKEDIKGTTTGIRMGNFASREAWLLHGNRYQGIDVGFSLNYSNADGPDELITEDAQTQYDKLYGTRASLAPGSINLSYRNWDIDLNLKKDHWKFHTLYQKRDDVGLGSGGAQALDPEGRAASDRIYTDLTYHNDDFAKNWGVIARVDHSNVAYSTERDFVMFPAGAFNGAFPEGMRANTGISERHANFDVSAIYKGIETHQIRLGLGYSYGEIYKVTHKGNYGINPNSGQPIPPTKELTDMSNTEIAFIPTGDRKSYHFFAQDIWTFNKNWEITSGIRYDRYSDFGSTINPRLALVWKVTPDFVTKLLYGKAFRAPSFQELYQVNNPVALGNVDLKPEKIQTWEIALNYRPSKTWHVGTNLFTYRLTDKILFIPDQSSENYHAQNAGSQKGHGVVIEGGWQFGENLIFLGNYAFQSAKNQLNDQVANVPKQDIYLRADWKFALHWHLNVQTNWILGRKRAINDPRPAIDDNLGIDLALHYQSLQPSHRDESSEPAWDVSFSIRNLLDSDLREPSSGPDENGKINIPDDLPMPGIHYFIGFNYRF